MSAHPNRITARGKLQVALASKLRRTDTEAVALVRTEDWNGVDRPVAFEGVVLLAGRDSPLAVDVTIRVSSRGWLVVLVPDIHRSEAPIAHYLRRYEALHLYSRESSMVSPRGQLAPAG